MAARRYVPAALKDASTSPSQVLVSCLTVERRGGHDHVEIWNRGGHAGGLVLEAGDGAALAERLGLLEAGPALTRAEEPPIEGDINKHLTAAAFELLQRLEAALEPDCGAMVLLYNRTGKDLGLTCAVLNGQRDEELRILAEAHHILSARAQTSEKG